MALHGDIRVNGNIIGSWVATREKGQAVDGKFKYRCSALWTDLGGYRYSADFEHEHKFTDGAIILASDLLRRAVEEMKRLS